MSLKKIYDEISRRNLMKYVGNAVVFAPFMRTLSETKAFGDDAPKRAVFYYFPDGIIPEKFHPPAGPLSGMNEMTAPLARVKNDVTLLRDTVYRTANSHQGGMRYCLTGMPDEKPGVSIDTVLGQKFKGPIDTLRLGVASHWQGGHDPQSCSWLMDKTRAIREDNPTKAFMAVFGGAAPVVMPGMTTPSMTKPVATSGLTADSKLSLLDANVAEINSLKNRLGAIEKTKLDAHIDAVRELERRIKNANKPMEQMPNMGMGMGMGTGSGGVSAQCTKKINAKKTFDPNDFGDPKVFQQSANIETVLDMMIEITVQALACRMTNVVLLQVGHSVWELPFGGGVPGSGRGHHSTSHYDAEGNVAEHVKGQAWMMNKLANLIEQMGQVKEGSQSLLYNSIVMGFSEFADSAKHAFSNPAIVLAGRQGGYFKAGGTCVSAPGASHNQTLVTILQSFGLTDNTFGQPDLGSGIIQGLKA